MKKTLFIFCLLVIIFSCVFPLKSFGNRSIEVRLNVYEIKVDCDENGSFIVNENTYSEPKSFFVAEDATISITAMPKKGYKIERIECDAECNSNLENDKLVIRNIDENIDVKIVFKSVGIPFFAGIFETEDSDKNENPRMFLCIWCMMPLFGILITIFNLICQKIKRKLKN